jgi:hypothetical protein
MGYFPKREAPVSASPTGNEEVADTKDEEQAGQQG